MNGASGTIGVGRAAAAPDGYTVSIGNWPSHVVNGASVSSVSDDVLTDFEPVARLPSNPYVVVARKDLPAADLKELTAWLKANSAKVNQGTAGPGPASTSAALYFQKVTGTSFQFVPYRAGSSEIMRDLVAGHIDLTFDEAITALPHIRAQSVKADAVTLRQAAYRWHPDIPTVDEARAPGVYIFHLVWPAGARGHAGGGDRQAHQDPPRRRDWNAARPTPHSAARAADRGGARRPPQGRDRKMVPLIKAANTNSTSPTTLLIPSPAWGRACLRRRVGHDDGDTNVDSIIRNDRLADRAATEPMDIAIAAARLLAVESETCRRTTCRSTTARDWLACLGLIETHIHRQVAHHRPLRPAGAPHPEPGLGRYAAQGDTTGPRMRARAERPSGILHGTARAPRSRSIPASACAASRACSR